MDLTTIKTLIAKAQSLSLGRKVILVILIALAAIFAVTSCTSTRSMAVTVDKAEKVDIHLTDSINGQLPMF